MQNIMFYKQSESIEEWREKLTKLINYKECIKTQTNKHRTNDKRTYQLEVKRITEQNKHSLKDIDKRGFNAMHIDHKVSIEYGYVNNIRPEHIAHLSNLRMITRKENELKGIKCYIDKSNEWILKSND